MRFLETFLSENSGATLTARFPPPEIFTAGTKALSPWAAPESPQVSHLSPHTHLPKAFYTSPTVDPESTLIMAQYL